MNNSQFKGPYGAFGILSSRMTFVLGVHLRYRSRLPVLADVLHMLIPKMYPDQFSLTRTPQNLYYLSKFITHIFRNYFLSYFKVNVKLAIPDAHLLFSLQFIWTRQAWKVNLLFWR